MYRVTLVVKYLGWVDLNLGSSLSWWATTAAIYCPSWMVELSISKSTQPKYFTTRDTLYSSLLLHSTYYTGISGLSSPNQPEQLMLSFPGNPASIVDLDPALISSAHHALSPLPSAWFNLNE